MDFHNDHSYAICIHAMREKDDDNLMCQKCGLLEHLDDGKKLRIKLLDDSSNMVPYENYLSSKFPCNILSTCAKKVTKHFLQREADFLLNGYREITKMGHNLKLLSPTIDRANMMFKQNLSNIQKSNHAIAAACLFISCRQYSNPHTFAEISKISQVPRKEIARCFKVIQDKLMSASEVLLPENFVSRFCDKLQLPSQVKQTATHISKKAVELGFSDGANPISIAAAAIYMASQASNFKRTFEDIANALEIRLSTVSRVYFTMLLPKARLLFPNDELI